MPHPSTHRKTPKARVRAPDETRAAILAAAFQEIYRNGFQAASLENILARTGVTKGALYHHFPDKHELGLAVLRETVRGLTLSSWVEPLNRPGDVIDAIQATIRRRADDVSARQVELGCPLNNLAQEMSPIDPKFRKAIEGIYEEWIGGIAAVLERGKSEGSVRQDVDSRAVAAFVVATIEGSYGLAKGTRDGAVLTGNFGILGRFMSTLCYQITQA
jgi:TetR/AcrR family transcriptional repressor of nem operon